MEHGRASIEIWFMMTQWELDRTSARYVIITIVMVVTVQCCGNSVFNSIFLMV